MTRTPILVLVMIALAPGCEPSRSPHAVVASGHVEATDVRVVTKVRGRLLTRTVDEGDVVEAGRVIAVVDAVDTELALREAKAERARSDAALRLSLAGARPEDIEELAARAESVEADLSGAEKELARQERLVAEGVTTVQSRDDALARRDILEAQLRAARESLARARAGNRQQEIEGARAQRDAADARIAQLEQAIADATIVSPLAGVVTEKVAEPGELLAPGALIVVVTDLLEPWLTVYVPEPDLGRVKLGATAAVVTDGGEHRSGEVVFIASKAEFTPKNVQTRDERVKLVFRVKIRLDNADGLFKPGMPAEARF